MRIAPHLVRPLEFMIPIYRGDERGPRLIRLGMVAYDALSMDKSLDRHKMLTAAEALEREPGLNPRGLRGGAFYFDAQAEYPERLARRERARRAPPGRGRRSPTPRSRA